MAQTLDEKLNEAVTRAAALPGLIRDSTNDAAMASAAYYSALARGDGAGADINLAGNKAANLRLTNLVAELKTLETPITGVIAILTAQKQIVLDAQKQIVANSLTSQQQTQIALAQTKAAGDAALAEASKPVKSNTTYIIIAVVVVILVSVFAYFKMKK